MTPGELADRLEALGRLPHNIELAPAAAAMLRELDELLAANEFERLRLVGIHAQLRQEKAELAAENERLRDLVHVLHDPKLVQALLSKGANP